MDFCLLRTVAAWSKYACSSILVQEAGGQFLKLGKAEDTACNVSKRPACKMDVYSESATNRLSDAVWNKYEAPVQTIDDTECRNLLEEM
jgi:hypothetical protein